MYNYYYPVKVEEEPIKVEEVVVAKVEVEEVVVAKVEEVVLKPKKKKKKQH